LLYATAAVAAQAPSAGKEKPTITPIARFVPAGAKLFVELRRPGEVEEALRDSQVGFLWSMAAGQPANPEQSSQLRSALAEFLAPNPAINVDELMKTEMGLMAPSWSDLSSAVWFARLPKPEVLDRWFPKDRRQVTTGATADSLFRMTDGMIVGVRDGIVAMARRGNAALVREVFRLMVGGVAETLHDSPAYRELVGYLPGKTLAVVYWAREVGEPGTASIASSFLPPIDHAVVGMSAGEGRIEFAIRAALWAPQARKTLAGHAIDRLLKLPATTLVACATTIDLNPTAQAAAGTSLLDWWAKALSFMAALRSANGDAARPLPSFGPHLILAWDQDLTAAGSSPQLALLMETKNARQLEAQFEAFVGPLIVQDAQNGSADDGDTESEPAITRDTHFGVSIAQASLYPDIEGLPLPLSQLMDELPLSWAAHGEWFIIALSREHIERILDAQFGLVPALSNVRDVQTLRKRRASQTSIVLLQPDLASDVLQRWVAAWPTPPKKLDPSLFSEPSLAEAVQRTRLGIGMQVEPEPGTVVVARVYPDTAADGHLLPDDRIIGVDGRLLDLETPNADLRRRWAEPSAANGHTFRVQREDTTIEVFLKYNDHGSIPEDLLTRSQPAIRALTSALRTIRFASVTVHPTDGRHFSALVSLRLAPPPSSTNR
jgi:hypothetical protein